VVHNLYPKGVTDHLF